MPAAGERYRKLPGSRRGFIRGSSVWMGSDHLLLVKSIRIREEYKRFHLRDIQAIVTARAPRFALSTRAAAIALLWVIVCLSAWNRWEWAPAVLWSVTACLVGAWVYVCTACSCVCRIYTAVSRDDLPSVYRTWTARRFLAVVEPAIGQVQGVVEGNWAEAIEDRTVGPARVSPPAVRGGEAPAAVAVARSRTWASDIFVASLFGDAALNLASLHLLTRTMQWVWYGLAFIQITCAIAIFWQRHRGVLRAGMQKLAVTTLVAMGIAYYARTAMLSVVSASNQLFPDMTALSSLPGYILLREIQAAICVALGLAGVALMVRGPR